VVWISEDALHIPRCWNSILHHDQFENYTLNGSEQLSVILDNSSIFIEILKENTKTGKNVHYLIQFQEFQKTDQEVRLALVIEHAKQTYGRTDERTLL